jgi:SAM-dependent methyltransferase
LKELFLSTTEDYHKNQLDSLVWEITLSFMLEDPRSFCRSILKKNASFGDLLYDLLETAVPLDEITRLVEVGGGYGYLMRDFLRRNDKLHATMIDLSPFLLAKQQEILREFEVSFIRGDFLDMGSSILSNFDLAILNEVIGDFPTACHISMNVSEEGSDLENPLLQEIRRICTTYAITPQHSEQFNINLGAIQALEKLCLAGVPHIYLSEHSCEARVPQHMAGLLDLEATGNPEMIRLHGHDEFTIRFSDLERVAAFFGYSTLRGQYIDFIEPLIGDDIEFILRLGSSKTDRHEIIRQFIEDLIKYEYLIISLPA